MPFLLLIFLTISALRVSAFGFVAPIRFMFCGSEAEALVQNCPTPSENAAWFPEPRASQSRENDELSKQRPSPILASAFSTSDSRDHLRLLLSKPLRQTELNRLPSATDTSGILALLLPFAFV